uniref:(northern house mosquito) hypothetical protein n=1 Tax=Culex pipiens TaxID=7175 RepID=A0A8D8BJ93_CULPI
MYRLNSAAVGHRAIGGKSCITSPDDRDALSLLRISTVAESRWLSGTTLFRRGMALRCSRMSWGRRRGALRFAARFKYLRLIWMSEAFLAIEPMRRSFLTTGQSCRVCCWGTPRRGTGETCREGWSCLGGDIRDGMKGRSWGMLGGRWNEARPASTWRLAMARAAPR